MVPNQNMNEIEGCRWRDKLNGVVRYWRIKKDDFCCYGFSGGGDMTCTCSQGKPILLPLFLMDTTIVVIVLMKHKIKGKIIFIHVQHFILLFFFCLYLYNVYKFIFLRIFILHSPTQVLKCASIFYL